MSGPQIMFVCDYCSEHNPEMCGHYDAEDIRLAPNGSWLCESCFDEETPSELGRFSDAPIAYLEAAPSPSPAPGVVVALPDNVLEDAAKAAFVKAQSVYRGLHDHLPLKNTWETLTESIRDGWRTIAHAALEAAYMPPLGTQPEPRLPRDVPSALASLSQPAKGEREGRLPTREEARQAARILLQCNGADLSKWGGDDLHDDSAQDALKELSR